MLYKGKETIGKWIVIVDSEGISSTQSWNSSGNLVKIVDNTHSDYLLSEDYPLVDYVSEVEYNLGYWKFVEELIQEEVYDYGGNVLSKWLELQQEPLSDESSTSTNTITPPEDKTSENSLTELTMTSLQSLIDGLGIDATLCLHSISGVTTYEIYSEEELLNFSCKDINTMVEYLGKVKNLIDWRKSKGE